MAECIIYTGARRGPPSIRFSASHVALHALMNNKRLTAQHVGTEEALASKKKENTQKAIVDRP